jgi:WD40 repeat protein
LDVMPIQTVDLITRVIELNNGDLALCIQDSTIRIYNLQTKLQVENLNGHSGEVRALVQLESGRLASGSCDSTINIWNYMTGVVVRTLRGHLDCVNDLVFSSGDLTLVSCSKDDTVKIWKNLHAKYVTMRSLKESRYGGINRLLLINSLNLLASGFYDGTIVIWHLESGQIKNCLYDHVGIVNSLVYLIDSDKIASASHDFSIKIWNYELGLEQKTLRGHTFHVFSIVLLKNGHLASASGDGSVKVWNTTSGKLIHDYHLWPNPISLDRNSDWVTSLCLLKSGNLVSVSSRGEIQVWQQMNGDENLLGNFFKLLRALTFIILILKLIQKGFLLRKKCFLFFKKK